MWLNVSLNSKGQKMTGSSCASQYMFNVSPSYTIKDSHRVSQNLFQCYLSVLQYCSEAASAILNPVP